MMGEIIKMRGIDFCFWHCQLAPECVKESEREREEGRERKRTGERMRVFSNEECQGGIIPKRNDSKQETFTLCQCFGSERVNVLPQK